MTAFTQTDQSADSAIGRATDDIFGKPDESSMVLPQAPRRGTIRELLRGDPADPLPDGAPGEPVVPLVVKLPEFCGFDHAVVLRWHNLYAVEVAYEPGTFRTVRADQEAELVTDAQRRLELLSMAAGATMGELHRLRSLFDTQPVRHSEHHQVLQDIRAYAIGKYRDGDICENGLQEFLNHFELGEYKPEVRVRFTISGSYTVSSADEDGAQYDARHHLRVDFSNIDDFVDDTDEVSVEVTDTELLD